MITQIKQRKILLNKKTGQYSLKIPKAFAERAEFNENTIAEFIIKGNPPKSKIKLTISFS